MSVREEASGPPSHVDSSGRPGGHDLQPDEGSQPDAAVGPPEVAELEPDLLEPDLLEAEARSRRPWVAGSLGATWALFVGLALLSFLVMGVWALSPMPAGDSGAAWRAVGLTWLGAHQSALTISGLPVTVLPLGAVVPCLLLARRGGSWSARLIPDPTIGELGALVGGAAMAYGAGGAGVAWLAGTERTGATLVDAFLACGAVAAVGALWGVARELELVGRMRELVPDRVWRTIFSGLAGALGLFVLGTALVALSLIVHVADAARSLGAIDGGILAAAGVTLVNVLTLPNLAIWGAAFAAGPGFTLGDLGSLSLFGGEVAALPALPVLVAIPSTPPAWAPVLLAGPVACGVIAGRVRWQGDVPSWPGALLTGLGMAAVVAPLVAAAVLLTSGSLGGGALAVVGPDLRPVTLAAVGLVLLGFLGEAAGQSLRLWWELHRAEQRDAAGALSSAASDADDSGAPDLGPAPDAPGAAGQGTDGQGADGPGAVAPGADGPEPAGPGAERAAPPRGTSALTSALLGAGTKLRSRVVWAGSSAPGQATGTPGMSDDPAPADGHVTVVLTRDGLAADPSEDDPDAGAEPVAAREETTPAADAQSTAPESAAPAPAAPESAEGVPDPGSGSREAPVQ